MTLYYDRDDMEEAAVAQRTEKVNFAYPRYRNGMSRKRVDELVREDRHLAHMKHLREYHRFREIKPDLMWHEQEIGAGTWDTRNCRLWGEGNCKWQ